MLYRIFGRKKYGKTDYCFEKLKENVQKGKKSYFLVPEQFTFAMEKRVSQELSNRAGLYVEVLSFTRLAHRVAEICGGVSAHLPDHGAKLLCMTKCLSALRSELREYGGAAEDIRFATPAVRAVQEFFGYHVTTTQIEKLIPTLAEHSPALADKLSDISLLAAAYRGELWTIYGTDGEVFDQLEQQLSDYAFFAGTDVFIDSFYSFMPQENRVIRHILRQADSCYVTVASLPNDTDPIFKRPRETEVLLSHMANEVGTTVTDVVLPIPREYNAISALERGFSTELCFHNAENGTDETLSKDDGTVRIIRCSNPSEEARAVAACIYRLVTEQGVRYRDIAVCARDIEAYDGILDIAFDTAEIPYTFSVSEELLTRPIISYITDAFSFASSFRLTAFLALLKTGLFRLTTEQCATLEEYVRTWNINGKKEFSMEWYMNPRGYKEEFSESDARLLEQVNEAKDIVMGALTKFEEDIRAASNAREIASAVYRYMCDSSYRDKAETEEETRIWNLTVSALDEMVRVYGDETISPARFSEIFTALIPEYGVRDIPKRRDVVLIGKADLIRSENIRYMFVIGCCNEAFPAQNAEDSVFSDNERQLLRQHDLILNEPSVDTIYDEFFLAYNLFCEPTDGLFILYPEKNGDGEAQRRSVLIHAVHTVLGTEREESFPFSNPLDGVTTAAALAEDMYKSDDAAFLAASKELLAERDQTLKTLFSESDMQNQSGKLRKEYAERLFGETMPVSPSRFESYSRCRFLFFNRHVLKLMPEVRAELDSVQTGIVSHKILEQFVSELAESKQKGALLTKEQARERIGVLTEAHFYTITHAVLSEHAAKDGISARFVHLYRRLCTVLTQIAERLVDELQQGDFMPVGFEVGIGPTSTVKPPLIPLPEQNGALCVTGQFDRADVYSTDEATYIRIIDYKTGTKKFKKDEIDYGFNLQMLLYLYCLIHSPDHPFGENLRPAGVLYVQVNRPDISATDWSDTKAASDKALDKAFKGNGILIDDSQVLRAMDKELGGRFIPVTVTQKGAYGAYSQICSAEELNALLKKAAEVSSGLSDLMKKGNIQINPYKTEKTNSCKYCDYLPICRLDGRCDGIRYEYEEVSAE